MYKRAGSVVTELKGSHALFISNAKAVADVIVQKCQMKVKGLVGGAFNKI
jgi:hypothetical protein